MKVFVLFLVVFLQVLHGNCDNTSDDNDNNLKSATDAAAMASNLRVTTLDYVHTLWWDSVDGREKSYTVYYADYYFDEVASWIPVKNCVDVTATNCVIDVYFDPLETYVLWVTTQGTSLTEVDHRDDVIKYSALEELLHETLDFSAPQFEAYRQKNRVDIDFQQIRRRWWNGETMAEVLYHNMGEWPKNNVTYYSCDESKSPNCEAEKHQGNFQLHSMKENKMSLVTTAKDSDTLCLDVHLVFDEQVSKIKSNHTKICFPPDSDAAHITPFVVASVALFLLLALFVYLFCRQNGKKVCLRALKIRQIEFPRPLDDILCERPNERTFEELIALEDTEEDFEPLALQFTASPTADVTHRSGDVITVAEQQAQGSQRREEIKIQRAKNEDNEYEQIYLKATDLGNFPCCADESAVTYSEVLSTEAVSGESSVQYMTLTESLTSSFNINNNHHQPHKHVCTSSCGYLEKDRLPFAIPCK